MTRSPLCLWPRWLAVALVATTALAQSEPSGQHTVRVQVTGVSGRDVYLDQGRAQGLEAGMVARLFPPGLGQLEVEIRSVSSSSARAELPPGAPPPPVGTRGEIDVPDAPASTSTPPAAGGDQRPVPDHPPWTRQEQSRSADQPLLVPTYGQRPDERPFTLDGRLFASTQYQRDTGGARASSTLLSRLGIWSEGHNALGTGERLRFAGELDDRRGQFIDQPDTDEETGRVDLASVAVGTEDWAPLGLEAGRFISDGLPEIGLIDGVEGVLRCEHGLRFGAGVGSYPLPFPGRDTGDDLGFHAFVDYVADDRRSFAAAVGVQKTWHQGAPDRDLLLLRADGRPADGFWLQGSAKIDLYTAGDTLKSPGPELTEFLGQARFDGARCGTGLALSEFRWPDLLRAEFVNLPPELVRSGHVERASWSGWVRATDTMRLSARADLWRDQDDHGTAFELAGDCVDVWGRGSVLSAAVFTTDGGTLSGPGMRVDFRRPFGEVFAHAGYRWYHYDVTSLIAGTETYSRQSVELGLDWAVGNFDLDFTVERWFGDQEDAFALGIFAQWRF
jgi:hypothetical protein